MSKTRAPPYRQACLLPGSTIKTKVCQEINPVHHDSFPKISSYGQGLQLPFATIQLPPPSGRKLKQHTKIGLRLASRDHPSCFSTFAKRAGGWKSPGQIHRNTLWLDIDGNTNDKYTKKPSIRVRWRASNSQSAALHSNLNRAAIPKLPSREQH